MAVAAIKFTSIFILFFVIKLKKKLFMCKIVILFLNIFVVIFRLISSVITTKVNRSRTVSDGEVLSQQEIQNGSVNPGFKLNYPESGSSNSKKESDNSKNGSSLDLLQMLTKAYQDFDLVSVLSKIVLIKWFTG